jgi:hypothetical protein
MRALILIAGVPILAVALAACSNNDQADNSQNIDENLTAENIVSNDVTAIDAVTGDAANMAAESNLEGIPEANLENSSNLAKPAAKKPSSTAKPDEPTTGTSGKTADNAAE